VLPAEVPPELFTSGAQRQQGPDDDLSLHANGIRLGLAVEHKFVAGSLLMLGAGADVVHFSAATYQGFTQSLTRPGWGVVPRTILGVRMPLKLNVLTIDTRPSDPPL
jgi:hypothetical protein